jgi:hypothetical protein
LARPLCPRAADEKPDGKGIDRRERAIASTLLRRPGVAQAPGRRLGEGERLVRV